MLGDTCGTSFWTSEEGDVREAGEVKACLLEWWEASQDWTSWWCGGTCKCGEGSKAAYLESCAQALSAWLGVGGALPFLSVCLGGVLTWHLEQAVAVGQRESNRLACVLSA